MTGDGGLFQCIEELHTAVEYDLDVTTVVFNNEQLGMISVAPELTDADRFGWRSPDFSKLAEGFGCEVMRAETPSETDDRIEEALSSSGPTVLEVVVDPDEPSSMDAWDYDSDPTFS